MIASPVSRWRWFGRVLEADFAFVARLPRASGETDVTLRRLDHPPSEGSFQRIFPVESMASEETWLEVQVDRNGRHRVRFAGLASFDVHGNQIDLHLEEGTLAEAEALFLGVVSALYLELGGSVCLHGSAVVKASSAVGFLGFNRAGKSSLAASFLAAGYPLLTDDVLALDLDDPSGIRALPGLPQIRLWPAAAEQLVEGADELEPVHPGFDKRRVPVGAGGLGEFFDAATSPRALLLPARGGAEIALELISPREATIELVRHSFLGALGEAAVGIGRRFERLVAIAERLPVYRLVYPEGLDLLPKVRDEILRRLPTL